MSFKKEQNVSLAVVHHQVNFLSMEIAHQAYLGAPGSSSSFFSRSNLANGELSCTLPK